MSDATDNRFYREKQEQPSSNTLVTAPENPTLEDLIAFYGEDNFRSGVTVRVPYRATRMALESLQERVAELEAHCDDVEQSNLQLGQRLRAAVPPEEVHRDGKFLRGWLQIDRLPGGMMMSNDGPFGPVPAMSSCLVTTSEITAKEWTDRGKPVLEFRLSPTKAPAPQVYGFDTASETLAEENLRRHRERMCAAEKPASLADTIAMSQQTIEQWPADVKLAMGVEVGPGYGTDGSPFEKSVSMADMPMGDPHPADLTRNGQCPVCGWPVGHCNVGCTAGETGDSR